MNEHNDQQPAAPRLTAAKKSEIAEAVSKRLLTDKKFLEATADKLLASKPFTRRIIIALAIVGAFAGLLYAAAGWFTLHSTISKTNEYLTNQFSNYVKTNDLEISKQLAGARKEVIEQITKEFETERIKSVVTAVASNRSNELLAEQIRPEISAFRATISNEIATTQGAIQSLKANASLVTLISEAETGDRAAWDKLGALADDLDYPFHTRALGAWQSVLVRYGSPTQVRFFPRYPDAFKAIGLMPTNATLNQIRIALPTLQYNARLETLQFVSEQSRFSKKEKLLFFRDVRRTDPRLEVCAWAGRHFSSLAPTPDVNPLHDDVMDSWLQKNLENVKD